MQKIIKVPLQDKVFEYNTFLVERNSLLRFLYKMLAHRKVYAMYVQDALLKEAT